MILTSPTSLTLIPVRMLNPRSSMPAHASAIPTMTARFDNRQCEANMYLLQRASKRRSIRDRWPPARSC